MNHMRSSTQSKPPERRFHRVGRIALETDPSDAMIHKLIDENVLTAVKIKSAVRVTDESYQRFLQSLRADR